MILTGCYSLMYIRLASNVYTSACLYFQIAGKYFVFFQNRVSLYSPGCPGTHSVDQDGLELRNPPASASRVLGLKACATTPGLFYFIFVMFLVVCQYRHPVSSCQRLVKPLCRSYQDIRDKTGGLRPGPLWGGVGEEQAARVRR